MQVTVAFHSNVRSNPNYFVCLLSELIVRPKIGNREKHQGKHGKYLTKLGKQ